VFITKDYVSLQIRSDKNSDLGQAKYTSVHWLNYPYYMFSKGPSGNEGVGGLLAEVAGYLRERMVSGKAGDSLVIFSDGGIRFRYQPFVMEAIRSVVAVLKDRRINAKLWIDHKTGKPIRLTSDKFIVYVRDKHIEELQRAVHGLFMPEDFLTITDSRMLLKEDRQLIKRYFDQTEDGFYKPKPRILRHIRFSSDDQKSDLQLFNYVEWLVEQEQHPLDPIATANIAHGKLYYFKEGAYFITTADKWYEDFFELTILIEAMTHFLERKVKEVPVYLMQYKTVDYSDRWFDQMFDDFLNNLEKRLIELYEAGLIHDLDPKHPVNREIMYAVWKLAKKGYSGLERARGQPYLIHPLRIILRASAISDLLVFMANSELSVEVYYAIFLLHDYIEELRDSKKLDDIIPVFRLKDSLKKVFDKENVNHVMNGVLLSTKPHKDTPDREFLPRFVSSDDDYTLVERIAAQIGKILDKMDNFGIPRPGKTVEGLLEDTRLFDEIIKQFMVPDFMKTVYYEFIWRLITPEDVKVGAVELPVVAAEPQEPQAPWQFIRERLLRRGFLKQGEVTDQDNPTKPSGDDNASSPVGTNDQQAKLIEIVSSYNIKQFREVAQTDIDRIVEVLKGKNKKLKGLIYVAAFLENLKNEKKVRAGPEKLFQELVDKDIEVDAFHYEGTIIVDPTLNQVHLYPVLAREAGALLGLSHASNIIIERILTTPGKISKEDRRLLRKELSFVHESVVHIILRNRDVEITLEGIKLFVNFEGLAVDLHRVEHDYLDVLNQVIVIDATGQRAHIIEKEDIFIEKGAKPRTLNIIVHSDRKLELVTLKLGDGFDNEWVAGEGVIVKPFMYVIKIDSKTDQAQVFEAADASEARLLVRKLKDENDHQRPSSSPVG